MITFALNKGLPIFQLCLVGFLVLLDELPVPLERVPGFLHEVFEAKPQLVLILGWHLALKQVPADEDILRKQSWLFIEMFSLTR
jgi:hypothetical protein